jgi:hypothetical protein
MFNEEIKKSDELSGIRKSYDQKIQIELKFKVRVSLKIKN